MSQWPCKVTVGMLLTLVSLAGCSSDTDETRQPLLEESQAITDCSIASEKELMITDLGVVNDVRASGNGPWSFGRIMTAMAGNGDVQQFVRSFVESWSVPQNVAGETVNPRMQMENLVLKPWRDRSAPGTYDLYSAPFKLLAIVYRVDLHKEQNVGAGAGEGRFIFNVVDNLGKPMLFTVITEFGLPTNGGKSAAYWAQQWHSLKAFEIGSLGFNQRLEEITNQFASPEARAGMVPGTQLNQLRTNEVQLDFGVTIPPIWEMREFHIEPDGLLHMARPALTPSNQLNGSATLSTYVKQNARAIQEGTHNVPVRFRGSQFSAGAAAVPTPDFTWEIPNVDSALAEQFSVQTCNGCHAGNTGTFFLHVGPGQDGAPARLSNFVIADVARRADIMKELLGCQ